MDYIWHHYDVVMGEHALDGIATAEAEGFVRGGALSDVQLAAQFRALLVFSAFNQARLVGGWGMTPMSGDTEAQQLDIRIPDLESQDIASERVQAAAALANTWAVLAQGGIPPGEFSTNAAEPDTGVIPAGVIVVGIVVAGAALCYLGHRTLETIDRQLARNAQNRALLQKHAAAERIIDQHLEREAAAGEPLPLDDASRTVLDQLGQLQRDTTPTAPPNPEPSGTEWNTLAWVVGIAIVAAAAAPLLKGKL